jgi:hypothetical protein
MPMYTVSGQVKLDLIATFEDTDEEQAKKRFRAIATAIGGNRKTATTQTTSEVYDVAIHEVLEDGNGRA